MLTTNEDIELMERVLNILKPQNTFDLVYRTPVDELRRQANEIEMNDRTIAEFEEWIKNRKNPIIRA